MIKCILVLISLTFYSNGFSQNQCINCLYFQGDSVSIDSSINISSYFFPILTDTAQFSDLPNGTWASLSDYSKEVELIFEMKDGKLNGRVVKIYIGVEQGIKNEIINFEEYTFIDSKANGKYIKWRNYTRKEINVEGYYLNNLKDSIWLDYYTKFADFALSSEAHYRYDKLHGRQKEWHPNGQLKSEKQCMFDDYIGKATLYYSNGRKYQDLFYLGGSSPFGENFKYVNIYDPKGKPLVVNGNGTHIILDENGAIWKTGPVKDGLRHGLWTKYPAGIFTSTETYNHGELID